MNQELRDCVLLVDDDQNITDALSVLLERDGRTTILCSDLESAEIALARYPVTHIVTDVQFTGSFGFEGLHSLERLRQVRPGCRILVMTGYATEDLRAAALKHGANAVLSKPFAIEHLEEALASEVTGGAPYEIIRVPPIEEVLRSGLQTAFQPLVRLQSDTGACFGYEALTRMRGPWALGGPAELFEYAARRARLTELNLAALQRAVEESASLPAGSLVFINVDPTAFTESIAPTLRAAAARANLSLDRVVLEITERSAFTDSEEAGRTFETLRALGVRFALDDHGSAYSHLGLIQLIRPSFIKISQSFGTGFEQDQTKLRIVKHIVALAHEFGAMTVLEGIETAETAEAAKLAGVDLAQGFHYARPSAASHWSDGARFAA